MRSLKKRDGKDHHRAVPVPPDYLAALDLVHDVKAMQRRPRKQTERLWPVVRMTAYRWVVKTMERAGIEGTNGKAARVAAWFRCQCANEGHPFATAATVDGAMLISKTTAIYLQVVGERGKRVSRGRFVRGCLMPSFPMANSYVGTGPSDELS